MGAANTYKFKKNESFYIRDGWFEKALNTINRSEENVFSKNNGSRMLGIGTNMAKSLKYWLQASGVIKTSSTKTELSEFGETILNYDPYFESDFTWYMMHYNFSVNKYDCPIFYYFFNSNIKKMKKTDIVKFLEEKFKDEGSIVKEDYIDDDLSVFLKSYINEEIVINPEDNYICPLSNLKLIKKIDGSIEKEKPSYNKLSSLLIYYCISQMYDFNSFNIEDSIYEAKSPCFIFNLDKNTYLQYLDELQRNGLLTINKTAGLNTVYFEKKLDLAKLFEMNFGGKR